MRFRSCSLAIAVVLSTLVPRGAGLLAQQTPSQNNTPAPNAANGKTPPAAAPAAPAQAKAAKPAPADDNPFPEEQSEAAQKEATQQDHADRKAAASGSAVDGTPAAETGSSSRDKLAGLDILGDHESRISNGAGGTVVDQKLSTQDLKVGQQYLGMGNYQGAYERFKEACVVNPANIDAVYYLAEAARRTAHLDESAQNYRIYLEAQPDGSKAKAARKALAQLQGK